MNESSSPSHDFFTLADIVGVYGIKGWVRLRIRLDDPNLLLSLSDLTLIAAPEAPRSARQSVVIEGLALLLMMMDRPALPLARRCHRGRHAHIVQDPIEIRGPAPCRFPRRSIVEKYLPLRLVEVHGPLSTCSNS